MTDHSALLWLPDALHDAGIPFAELTGWKANQPRYYWTDTDDTNDGYRGVPVGWMWHHTATAGFHPVVKDDAGRTKANLWMGLARGNRLYEAGGGPPTVVLASSGPGNFTAGTGKRWVLDSYVAEDDRFHGPQRQPDDVPKWYGNRYYGATETVHRGNGSPMHPGVWEMQVQVAAILCRHFDWSPWRHIGHLDHTRRKVDPRVDQGAPYSIGLMQDQVAALLSPPPPPPPGGFMGWTMREGDGVDRPLNCVKWAQASLNGWVAQHPNPAGRVPIKVDGIFGPATTALVIDYQPAAQFNRLTDFDLGDPDDGDDNGDWGLIDGVTATFIGRFHPETTHTPPGTTTRHGSSMHTEPYAAFPHDSAAHTDEYAAADHADTHRIV